MIDLPAGLDDPNFDPRVYVCKLRHVLQLNVVRSRLTSERGRVRDMLTELVHENLDGLLKLIAEIRLLRCSSIPKLIENLKFCKSIVGPVHGTALATLAAAQDLVARRLSTRVEARRLRAEADARQRLEMAQRALRDMHTDISNISKFISLEESCRAIWKSRLGHNLPADVVELTNRLGAEAHEEMTRKLEFCLFEVADDKKINFTLMVISHLTRGLVVLGHAADVERLVGNLVVTPVLEKAKSAVSTLHLSEAEIFEQFLKLCWDELFVPPAPFQWITSHLETGNSSDLGIYCKSPGVDLTLNSAGKFIIRFILSNFSSIFGAAFPEVYFRCHEKSRHFIARIERAAAADPQSLEISKFLASDEMTNFDKSWKTSLALSIRANEVTLDFQNFLKFSELLEVAVVVSLPACVPTNREIRIWDKSTGELLRHVAELFPSPVERIFVWDRQIPRLLRFASVLVRKYLDRSTEFLPVEVSSMEDVSLACRRIADLEVVIIFFDKSNDFFGQMVRRAVGCCAGIDESQINRLVSHVLDEIVDLVKMSQTKFFDFILSSVALLTQNSLGAVRGVVTVLQLSKKRSTKSSASAYVDQLIVPIIKMKKIFFEFCPPELSDRLVNLVVGHVASLYASQINLISLRSSESSGRLSRPPSVANLAEILSQLSTDATHFAKLCFENFGTSQSAFACLSEITSGMNTVVDTTPDHTNTSGKLSF